MKYYHFCWVPLLYNLLCSVTGDICFVHRQSNFTSLPTSPLPFSSTHTAAVVSQPLLHLLSSAFYHIALRLNISAFLFDVFKIQINFAVCVIGNESSILEYIIRLKIRTMFSIFDQILSKLWMWPFWTTSRAFWPVSENVNVRSCEICATLHTVFVYHAVIYFII